MQCTKDSNFPRASGAQTPAMQALRPAPGPYRFHLGIGIYGALHAPKPPEQGKIPSYNSLCRALRPVSDPYSRFHLGVGHYGALHTPKPPWFLSGERKEPKLAGETPAPLSVRHNRHARKIFLRGFPTSGERFFRWRGFPRGAAKGLFFLVAHPGTGRFLRGHSQLTLTVLTSTVPRAVRPLLNVLFGSPTLLGWAFFHIKKGARVWGRGPPQINSKMQS